MALYCWKRVVSFGSAKPHSMALAKQTLEFKGTVALKRWKCSSGVKLPQGKDISLFPLLVLKNHATNLSDLMGATAYSMFVEYINWIYR